MENTPVFTNDTIVFGLLMISLGIIFYTSSRKEGFWFRFYKVVPALFMAYMLPAVLTTLGLIAPEWETTGPDGSVEKHASDLYFMSSRYLLPAALVLMTLSIDLKAVFNLGWKALAMFFTGTLGIVLLVAAGIFALTSFISFCPLYAPFGIRTCAVKEQ